MQQKIHICPHAILVRRCKSTTIFRNHQIFLQKNAIFIHFCVFLCYFGRFLCDFQHKCTNFAIPLLYLCNNNLKYIHNIGNIRVTVINYLYHLLKISTFQRTLFAILCYRIALQRYYIIFKPPNIFSTFLYFFSIFFISY